MTTTMIEEIRQNDTRRGKCSNLTASTPNIGTNVSKGKQKKWEASMKQNKCNRPMIDAYRTPRRY